MRGPLDRLFPNIPHAVRVALDWALTIVVAVLVVLGVKAWIVNPYRIPSPSMETTLHCARPEAYCEGSTSDRVLANRFIYHFRDPGRGEIVVFHSPPAAAQECREGGVFVKRIIGLPGERWSERNGFTYINGRRLSEPYVRPSHRGHETRTLLDLPPRGTMRRIPQDMYLMEGDNRIHSCDSRVWGLVPRGSLIGKAFLIYWPLSRIGVP